LKATMFKSIECEESIEDFMGAHERSCWWLLWRILGGSGFTIIFGLITILGSVSVLNSHFILSCILLHNSKYSTWHMYWHPKANIKHIVICMSCIFAFHNLILVT
jgi:hypothetical protein